MDYTPSFHHTTTASPEEGDYEDEDEGEGEEYEDEEYEEYEEYEDEDEDEGGDRGEESNEDEDKVEKKHEKRVTFKDHSQSKSLKKVAVSRIDHQKLARFEEEDMQDDLIIKQLEAKLGIKRNSTIGDGYDGR